MERACATNPRIHTPKIMGADCAVSSLETGGYIANLPPNRWAKRALEWQPRAKRVGRRTNTWVTKIDEFARWKRWDNWQNVAMHNHALWEQSMLEFVQFTIGK